MVAIFPPGDMTLAAAEAAESQQQPLTELLGGHHSGPSWYRWYAVVLVALDLASIGFAGIVANAATSGMFLSLNGNPARDPFVAMSLLIGSAWVVMLSLSGAYKRQWLGTGAEEYRRVLGTAGRSLALVALVSFLFDIRLGRGFVAVTVALGTLTSLALRYSARHCLHSARARGQLMKRVLVVGSQSACDRLSVRLLGTPHAGLRPVGVCCDSTLSDLIVGGELVPVLGPPSRVLTAALAIQADAIAIADLDTLGQVDLGGLAGQLEGTAIELLVTPAATEVAGPRISIRPVFDLPLMRVEEPQLKGLPRAIKSLSDRLLALVTLLLLFPLLLVIALTVRASSRGPIIFRQTRVGLGGRYFRVWKFRTMTRNAEASLSSILHLNEHDGVLFKMKDDPRVTGVGRMLRRWSLDELPQLWNVLRGDMSIVGPRPPIPSEVERYDDHVRQRLLVKPGITGLWQVSGRSALPWDEAVQLDLHYVENWSLSMDAVIVARTALAVLRRHGAY